jgi:replicative DNA helicase
MNTERGLISKILETKDILTLKEMQITPEYLIGEHRRALVYIQDSVFKNGEVPTVRAFNDKFPHYDLDTKSDGEVGTDENLRYWCNEIRAKVRHNRLAEAVEKSAKMLDDSNAEEALSVLKKNISVIENQFSEITSTDITKNTEERKTAYLERKKNKGMRGIPTGIKLLDYNLHGLEKQTLTTLVAQTGVGKTFLEVIIGAYCMLQNYRVAQYITEMSDEIMRDRYEAVLFSMIHGEFNYQNFKNGALTPEEEKAYFKFLERDLPSLEPLILRTATGVTAMSAEIDEYKPDLVLIDGVYLMEDDAKADSDWLRITNITRDLKKLAKSRDIPILINTQADQNTSIKTGPALGDIKYSQSIGQDSDNVFTLFRDEQMLSDREMCVKILKQREGILAKFMMNWDFNVMDFSCIYQEEKKEVTVSGKTVEMEDD